MEPVTIRHRLNRPRVDWLLERSGTQCTAYLVLWDRDGPDGPSFFPTGADYQDPPRSWQHANTVAIGVAYWYRNSGGASAVSTAEIIGTANRQFELIDFEKAESGWQCVDVGVVECDSGAFYRSTVGLFLKAEGEGYLLTVANTIKILTNDGPAYDRPGDYAFADFSEEGRVTFDLPRCEFRAEYGRAVRGDPFDPMWQTADVLGVARRMSKEGHSAWMPILADALEDAGYPVSPVLAHCRGSAPHSHRCWVLDHILGAPDEAAVDRVLRTDAAIRPGASSAAEVAARMRAIDTAGCPDEFSSAFRAHVRAWELLAEVERDTQSSGSASDPDELHTGTLVRELLCGERDGGNYIIDGPRTPLQQRYQTAKEEIERSFDELREVARWYYRYLTYPA